MNSLLAAPALAPARPFAATQRAGGLQAAARLHVVAAAQRRQAARRQPAAPVAAAASAAALAGSLGLPPAALAAAAADPQAAAAAQVVYELAALDSATAGTLAAVLKPALSLASLLMIVRIVMSWYPEIDGKQMPWSIAYTPTGERGRAGGVGMGGWRACRMPSRKAFSPLNRLVVALLLAPSQTQGVLPARSPGACSLATPPTRLPVACPAEPLLEATRKVVPPFNGLDVSPIVWVALLSFLAEILTGPQVRLQ